MKIDHPTPSYVVSYKAFRDESNENQLIARYIFESKCWQKIKPICDLSVLDIGCGDGRIVSNLASLDSRINKIYLIDPDQNLLSDAINNIDSEHPDIDTFGIQAGLSESSIDQVDRSDVVLIIHTLYLLKSINPFLAFLNSAPSGTTIFVVIDDLRSVFAKLWEVTAPKYHKRLVKIHDTLRNLNRDSFTINSGEITTVISDPRNEPNLVRRRKIISHMGYCDYEHLDASTRKHIFDIFDKNQIKGSINLYSKCYQLVKL